MNLFDLPNALMLPSDTPTPNLSGVIALQDANNTHSSKYFISPQFLETKEHKLQTYIRSYKLQEQEKDQIGS
tara:strand:+ start:2476 stop:2691 length:216 start_codon:yes stop_codon:yes gene_type:complete